MGDAAFADAWAARQGRSLEAVLDEILARATGGEPRTPPLSRREREGAALLARGQTNRQIGLALNIAERTVDTHVGHILHKLGVATRAEAAARIADQVLRA